MNWLISDPTFAALLATLRAGRPASLDGVWGSSTAAVATAIAHALARPVVLVTTHLDDADNHYDDVELFSRLLTPSKQAESATETDHDRTTQANRVVDSVLFPAWETKPSGEGVGDEIEAERLAVVSRLAHAETAHRPAVIVTPVQALMQPVPTPEALAAHVRTFKVGDEGSPELAGAWLVERGFTRLEQVEVPGDFSLRGGILDIWPAGEDEPIRIEYFDVTIESIRRFNPSSQRSGEKLSEARVAASLKASEYTGANTQNLLSYLGKDAVVLLDEPGDLAEHGKLFWSRLSDPTGLYPISAVLKRANERVLVEMARFGQGTAAEHFHLDITSIQRLESAGIKASEIAAELGQLASEHAVTIFCEQQTDAERLTELLTEALGSMPAGIRLEKGLLHQGFVWRRSGADAPGGDEPKPARAPTPAPRGAVPAPHAPPPRSVAYVGHHEIFHRAARKRKLRRVAGTRAIDSFVDLNPGDYVVHRIHGIAKFEGLQQLEQHGRIEEFLTLLFADDAKLHVPVSQIELVHKYSGFAGHPPLSKIGGSSWQKTKEKAEAAVLDMAEELLGVQAKRQSLPGIEFPGDSEWQREFEGSFPYTETEDQLRVIREIKRDQMSPRPMDRLLCGDVGYGKTEMAMRAAFKAVDAGYQVAVLVPTTVLAQQHLINFRERFSAYPFRIDCLNRFRTAQETREIIKAAKEGSVDILIGTHRILSRDVGFAHLGLVVIDEEQRFGVEHKERLKEYRATVDVLTLTATPIPRTLHFSMLGLRDISTLTTAPLDRRSIVSRVLPYDEKVIKEALARELNRDGQAFFVHTRVSDIHELAANIQSLAPGARIVVGHGQMPPGELEQVMTTFINRQADILVSTTIIESGIDIPTANTIFVNNAHDFGLADLHQLRGRVGRYKHKAYAYFLIPNDRPLTQVAARRLKAIEEFSELGAGFRIAMQDLEIRGAGNILGAEQSGHINAIGYDLYCELLEQAVKKLKNEGTEKSYEVHIELGFTGSIPRSYIQGHRQRMEVYRRMARVQTQADVDQLMADLKDAFGPIPPEVQTLIDLAELKVACIKWKVKSILLKPPDLVFTADDFSQFGPLLANAPGSVRIPDESHVHLRLPTNYLVPRTLTALLRKLLMPQKQVEVPVEGDTAQPAGKPAAQNGKPSHSVVRPPNTAQRSSPMPKPSGRR